MAIKRIGPDNADGAQLSLPASERSTKCSCPNVMFQNVWPGVD